MHGMPPIDLDTAGRLIDFSGRSDAARAFAGDQLEGAVALYNMLAEQGCAYLADEVGMGKTYVALGVVGLLRHFQPGARVLYIAPRENIQRKWHKELLNFTRNNWRLRDNRVKTLQGDPVAEPVPCRSLADLLHQVVRNANRDFLLRLPSFSLAIPPGQLRARRRALLHELPWSELAELDLRQAVHRPQLFKDAYARALNAVLPEFDLVLVDEAHNLKHGYGPRVAARNRVLALALGRPDPEVPLHRGGGPRARRVLLLSATPLEGRFVELWNQLDVLGCGDRLGQLADAELDPAAARRLARRVLVRRLARMDIGGRKHTKNMIRREWRGGGVTRHDEPLAGGDDHQRLIVALVQKKVTDALARQGRRQGRGFKRSFQIGMLASFESFLQTAKVRPAGPGAAGGDADDADDADDGAAAFDGAAQTDDRLEREGLDTPTVDRIAAGYRRRFGRSMPHPKMDAVAAAAAGAMLRGEKTLVFVRRVASVAELADKIGERYDDWLHGYLHRHSRGRVRAQIDRAFQRYRDQRRRRTTPEALLRSGGPRPGADGRDDAGGRDTFFAWFFRGAGHDRKLLSGAAFRRNRLDSESGALSTLLLDNHLVWLLGDPEPLPGLAAATGLDADTLRDRLRDEAYRLFRRDSSQHTYVLQRVYMAYQEAALRLLAAMDSDLGRQAQVLLDEVYPHRPAGQQATPDAFPGQAKHTLHRRTLFTALAARPGLCEALWPQPDTSLDFREALRERELRRELLAGAIRLGHPFIDLWLQYAKQLRSLAAGRSQAGDRNGRQLIADYLDALEHQRDRAELHGPTSGHRPAEPSAPPGPSSYSELAAIGRNYDLILDTNLPAIHGQALSRLRAGLAPSLSNQTPVGGMWGRVNDRLLRQFRMPGYPYALITTDVLQEGEDLHTFCSRVMHYGISWTPSSMEQRTGRVDRIGSQTHRRLARCDSAAGEDLLQVYYPFLAETYESVQVCRLMERMNHFLELLHRDFGTDPTRDGRLDVSRHILTTERPRPQIKEPLQSAFDIDPKWLPKKGTPPAIDPQQPQRLLRLFDQLITQAATKIRIDDLQRPRSHIRQGTTYLRDDTPIPPGADRRGTRKQPFQAELRTATGGGRMILRCTSPIGFLRDGTPAATYELIFSIQRRPNHAKISAIRDTQRGGLHLTADADILFHPATTQPEEVRHTIERAVRCADVVEKEVFGIDEEPGKLLATLRCRESDRE